MILSVDLGQANDYTAISVIKQEREILQVIHLERFPLGMSYPLQAERISQLFHKLTSPLLVIDRTGVGRAVTDLLNALNPVAISITGGNDATYDGLNWNVPKRDLIHNLVVLFQGGKIKIARSLPPSDTLIKELLNFKLKVNIATGHDSYEALREGIHDDLVLSVAMGVYVATIEFPQTYMVYYEEDYEISPI